MMKKGAHPGPHTTFDTPQWSTTLGEVNFKGEGEVNKKVGTKRKKNKATSDFLKYSNYWTRLEFG